LALLELDRAFPSVPIFTSDASKTRDGADCEEELRVTATGTALSGAAFALAYYCLRLITRDLFSDFRWYKKLQRKAGRTKLFELYLLSVVNAMIVTVFSLKKTGIHGIGRPRCRDIRGTTRLMASMLGYFLHDFVAMRREILTAPDTLIHHVFGIAILTAGMRGESRFKRYGPPLAIVELSTCFLSTMWILRELGLEKTRTFKAVLAGFVLSFFATRVVILPSLVWRGWNDPDFQKGFGRARYLLAGLSVLNLWWFRKIVNMGRKAVRA
jgi:hypothetical protein